MFAVRIDRIKFQSSVACWGYFSVTWPAGVLVCDSLLKALRWLSIGLIHLCKGVISSFVKGQDVLLLSLCDVMIQLSSRSVEAHQNPKEKVKYLDFYKFHEHLDLETMSET